MKSLSLSNCLPGVRECSEHTFLLRTHVLKLLPAFGYGNPLMSRRLLTGRVQDRHAALASRGGDRIAGVEGEIGPLEGQVAEGEEAPGLADDQLGGGDVDRA